MYQPKKPITTSEDVQRILGEKFESQEQKAIDHIDDICREWIERSPFVTQERLVLPTKTCSHTSRNFLIKSDRDRCTNYYVVADRPVSLP